LVDQNGYKKGVYSEQISNSGHLQLFYFSNILIKVVANGMIKLMLNLAVKNNFCLTNFNNNNKKIMIEEFKQCIHSDIKTYIDEHNNEQTICPLLSPK
jgi:hypothetical protein